MVAANVMRMDVLAWIDSLGRSPDRPAKFYDRFVDFDFTDCDFMAGRNRIAESDDPVADNDLLSGSKTLEGDNYGIADMKLDNF